MKKLNGLIYRSNTLGDCSNNGISSKYDKVVCYFLNENEIAELLPTSSGFFFGSYEYDEYYFNDLRETIDVINNVLDETDFETYTITYCSSW